MNPSSDLSARQTAAKARILVVDDELVLRRTLAELLKRAGYETVAVGSGQEALVQIAQHEFDLAILDLRMPEMDGTQVLQAARPLAPHTVFIILTAFATLDSAITTMRNGASDYLLKPSSPREIITAIENGLVERQKRLLSAGLLPAQPGARLETRPEPARDADPPSRLLRADHVTVDIQKHLVLVDGQPIDLTPTEYDILIYLLRNPDRVISHREFAQRLRGVDLDERDARLMLHTHLSRLRQKLTQAAGGATIIHTARSSGFWLDSTAQTIAPDETG